MREEVISMHNDGFFTVIRLHRDDIHELLERQGELTEATRKQIAALTDEAMEIIAGRVAEGMMESMEFWDSLEAAIDDFIKRE
jgi:hypothetical protein